MFGDFLCRIGLHRWRYSNSWYQSCINKGWWICRQSRDRQCTHCARAERREIQYAYQKDVMPIRTDTRWYEIPVRIAKVDGTNCAYTENHEN